MRIGDNKRMDRKELKESAHSMVDQLSNRQLEAVVGILRCFTGYDESDSVPEAGRGRRSASGQYLRQILRLRISPSTATSFSKGIYMNSEERRRAIQTALVQMDKQFGKGAVLLLGSRNAIPVTTISTGSLSVDHALGVGGVPRGRVIEIYGPESSGKTTLTLHIIAEAQKAGGYAASSMPNTRWIRNMRRSLGVDVDNLIVSQPDTGEQALEIASPLVATNAVDLIVIDSVAALVPRAELEGEMGDSHVGLQARLMSQALAKADGTGGADQHVSGLHQPIAREDRRDVR